MVKIINPHWQIQRCDVDDVDNSDDDDNSEYVAGQDNVDNSDDVVEFWKKIDATLSCPWWSAVIKFG